MENMSKTYVNHQKLRPFTVWKYYVVAENQQVVILVLFLTKSDVRIDVNSLWCDRAAAGPQLLTT